MYIDNSYKKNKLHLTHDHLVQFNEMLHDQTHVTDTRFREFEAIIQNCDGTSDANRMKLLRLSRMILNHFSNQSITWILAIYKKVMNISETPSDPEDYTQLIHQLLNQTKRTPLEDYARRFKCIDLVEVAPQATSLETQFIVSKALVQLLTNKIHQEIN